MLTGCNDIVYHKHLLSWLNRIGLNFEVVLAVLLLESGDLNGTRQLSSLPHRNEGGTQSQSKRRTKQEAARLQADNNLWLVVIPIGFQDVQIKATDESVVKFWILKDGKNVLEQDTRSREVFELPQSAAKHHLKTGEFGGAGGRGGDGDLGGDMLASRICLLTTVLARFNVHWEEIFEGRKRTEARGDKEGETKGGRGGGVLR
jgi:hypothetical protein